ncbi:hypothetical protein OA93_14980 [Flavobacterium sp. KMS]|uniref:hypothetical protein n=1 Tax=Flavobacterium sp. KMS TaxID=1566023 RepID=UPI00057ECE5F|nr:hypothetical protein [Flavobacterium sp. KMS]KIA97237.1 hypothetical protein OA93_14980 [Flavobacterium sp. KMS]
MPYSRKSRLEKFKECGEKFKKQINKGFVLLFFVFFIVSCGPSKDAVVLESEFVEYLKTVNIDRDTIKDFKYFKEFLAYKKEQDRQSLLENPILKVNEVYAYQGDKREITFCVFSDDGYLYMAEAYKTGSMLLTEPKDGKIEFKKPVELIFLGFFELNDTILKISRHEKTSLGERNQSDLGYVKKDTITLTAFYNTKKYGYKKKGLAKTHNTNFKLVYQPNLTAIKTKNELGSDTFRIEGSFTAEKNLEEDKMLDLLDKAKF